ncbi:hypothetical protein NMG60_11003560 [Bertholletia excelsa]
MMIPKIIIRPQQIFKSRKSWSVSRSDPSSFSSGSSSSSSSESLSTHFRSKSEKGKGKGTPTSVLPPTNSPEISEISVEIPEVSGALRYDMVHTFKMMDRDGDGKITAKDLGTVLSRVGANPPSEEELMLMLSDVDKDGDGCISLQEFGAISSAFGPPASDTELRDTFDFFDKNHDGRITPEELHEAFATIGDDHYTLDECRRMISGVDKNGNGFVCIEDFARMMELQR